MNNKMVIIRIHGGFGNQLFCLNYARYLKNNSYENVFIDINSGFIDDIFKRKFEISQFINQNDNILFSKIKSKVFWRFFSYTIRILELLLRKFRIKNRIIVFEDVKNVNYIPGIYNIGFWQNQKYLISDNEEFLNVFNSILKINKNQYQTSFPNVQIIGLHYRSKDYDHKLNLSYYKKAIERIYKEKNQSKFQIHIFTDELNKAKKELSYLDKKYNCKFFNQSLINDFIDMASCDHLIIARSTFSWWAAYFLNNKNKKALICIPKILKFTENQNLLLDRWIPI